jgi:hypothetical protein
MVNMPDSKGNFFSVRYATTIRGVRYIPSVCYKLTRDLQQAVADMAKGENPLARIYPEEMRFITGVAYPVKKPEAASRLSSVSAQAASAGKPGSKKVPGKTRVAHTRRDFD